MSNWIGWVSLVFFIIAGSMVASNYYFVWHIILQRDEPFTRQYARIAERWLWESIVFVGLQLAGAILINIFGNTWERIFGLIGAGFFAWFIPHIVKYVQDHHGDNPPYTGMRRLVFGVRP